MASVQERLKLKRVTVDVWNTKEKLALATFYEMDKDFSSVSKKLKQALAAEQFKRPDDWFSQKNCALQYNNLLETVETPKRKKRSFGQTDSVEAPGLTIIRKLKEIRNEEVAELMRNEIKRYWEIMEIARGVSSNDPEYDDEERLEEISEQFAQLKAKRAQEAVDYEKMLIEREEQKRELERTWRSNLLLQSLRRDSSISEPSSDADSPLSEPLAVDVPEDVLKVDKPLQPASTPTSPLLTSLLKSPSAALTSSAHLSMPTTPSCSTSILHSAITSPIRGGSPTIASLLNSSSAIPSPLTSPLKTLTFEESKPVVLSPSQGAPTLSMLLELPPSMPGQPLPVLQPVPTCLPAVTAPPPYTEHLGPPPPYSLATEYLQKQRAEALQAQQAILNVEKELMQATMGPLAVTSPIKQTLKTDVLVDLADIEEVIAGDSSRSQYNIAGLLNSSDHDYNLIKPRIDIIQDSPALAEMPVEIVEELIIPSEVSSELSPPPTAPTEDKRQEKKDLDVFEFGEDEDADANGPYTTSIAKRLAEKAEAKISSPSKITKIDSDVTDETVQDEATDEITDVSPLQDGDTEIVFEIKGETPAPVEEKRTEAEAEVNPAPIEPEPEPVPDIVQEEEPSVEASAAPVVQEVDTPSDLTPVEPLAVEIPEEKCEEKPADESCEAPSPGGEAGPSAAAGAPRSRRGTRAASYSNPNSPSCLTEEEKEQKAWKRTALHMHSTIEGHKSASVFLRPITDDIYSNAVKRPMDLSTIKRNIECGLIRTTAEYKRDIMLMFLNARMYNKTKSIVFTEANCMEKDCLENIEMLSVSLDETQPSKRELRTHGEKTAVKRPSRASIRGAPELKKKRTSISAN